MTRVAQMHLELVHSMQIRKERKEDGMIPPRLYTRCYHLSRDICVCLWSGRCDRRWHHTQVTSSYHSCCHTLPLARPQSSWDNARRRNDAKDIDTRGNYIRGYDIRGDHTADNDK